MNFINIGSGSKGNATLLFDSETTILIDCGICTREINKALGFINRTIDDIDYVFITHNHIDHIKNISIVSPNKIYSLKDTVDYISPANFLTPFKEYDFKTFKVTPILTSHDAPNPTGYLFKNNNEELVYITDTGYIPTETLGFIKNKDIYIMESNHDIQMLLESRRSNILKARILSTKGHLANDLASKYLLESIGNNTKAIFLAHISEECNTEVLALETLYNELNRNNFNGEKLHIECLKQREIVEYYGKN